MAYKDILVYLNSTVEVVGRNRLARLVFQGARGAIVTLASTLARLPRARGRDRS